MSSGFCPQGLTHGSASLRHLPDKKMVLRERTCSSSAKGRRTRFRTLARLREHDSRPLHEAALHTCPYPIASSSCVGLGRDHWPHLTGEQTEAQGGLGLVQGHTLRGAVPGLAHRACSPSAPPCLAEPVRSPRRQVVTLFPENPTNSSSRRILVGSMDSVCRNRGRWSVEGWELSLLFPTPPESCG